MRFKEHPLANMPFAKLCLSGLLFFTSFNMIIPELPNYLSSMGGEDFKGLIISLFTLTAGISRPFSGKLADSIGRIPVMIIGVSVCVVCGLLYPMVNTVFALLFLRFLHGISTGFKPTGTAAFVADVAPEDRRGEAMSYLGFFNMVGLALGPYLGGEIALRWNVDAVFYTSTVFAFLSIVIIANMNETLQQKQKFSFKLLKIKRQDVYTPRVLPAAIVMMFGAYPFGMVLTLVPDFSQHLGLANKGAYFAFFTLSSMVSRLLFGRFSDIYGREPVIACSLAGAIITLVITGMADSGFMLIVCACSMGIFAGHTASTILAWTIDLGDRKHIGRAMATIYIALEIGIGSGAFISGLVYANAAENFKFAFWLSALCAFIALVYLLRYMMKTRRGRFRREPQILSEAN